MQRRNRTDGAPENAPIIAIVGRPNVGKSTLFNAIYGERRAIVEDVPGVTRDRNYGFVNRFAIPFHIVDTGGYEANATDEIQRHTVAQTVVAIEEADAIIALFDANTGVHPTDEEVVQLLRSHGKPTYFVVNKCDGKEQNVKAFEFYQLGVPEVLTISALEGLGVRELTQRILAELPNYKELVDAHEQWLREREAAEELSAAVASAIPVPDEDVDEATELLEKERAEEEQEETHPIIEDFAPVFVPGESGLSEEQYDREYRLLAKRSKRQYVFAEHEQAARAALAEEFVEDPASAIPVPVKFEQLRVAIVGRPNVGKSTLLNQLLGETRAITSPIAGTTRDAIDAELEHEGMRYILVDTAGVRKQSRIDEGVERYSTLRSLRAIVQADVVIAMVDAVEGPTEQDVKLASLAHEHGKGLIIAINKWDAVEKDHRSAKQMTERAEEAFKFAAYAPISFISAISGRRCIRLLDTALEIANQRLRRIPTGQLNQLLQRAHRRSSAPSYRGIPLRLYFGSQIDVAPVTVVLFLNQIRNLHFSYLRFLQNEIREEFNLTMTDVKLIPRKRQ